MIDAIAGKYIESLLASHDRVDTMLIHYGIESIEYKEALEEHMKMREHVTKLIRIGLEHQA